MSGIPSFWAERVYHVGSINTFENIYIFVCVIVGPLELYTLS